uniref:protein angel homolog 1 isoform X2 n=1 Tax=Scatophagus argus TaxID=75038 RepID=UPI001ED855CF|nr:protein angel homolog 1 isoform X2 [Scatophagus argus]
MIGSLLFYALYPLSRYLTNRFSGASKKGLPPAVVYGTAAWDGGTVTTRRFIQSQTTLLDQCLSPNCGVAGETKERMKEPSLEKDDSVRLDTDKEQLTTVLHEETKNEASQMFELQPPVKEKEAETRNRQQQDKVEGPMQEDEEIIHHKVSYMKKNTEYGCIFPTDRISPEQELKVQLEHLQTEDSSPETTCPVQKKIKIPSLEESVTSAEPSISETTIPLQEEIQTPSVEVSDKTTAEVTEYWDEYAFPTADGINVWESSKLISASLLSHTQNHLKVGEEYDKQTGWHFPAGPGLAEAQCPLWQCPAMSYYPPADPTVPFEVMWRVMEERDETASAAEPVLKPFPFTKALMDFTVMSYNILAEDLLKANQELYTHCPLEVLDWSYRCSLLLEEILKWAPDILCLQEVQENHYHEQLYPALSQMGYACVYKRRTGTKTDGCAICYRSSCFLELSVTPLEFFRPETGLLDRHNVGIVLLLRPVVTRGSDVKALGPPLCVANTHLLFNPRRGDVKLAQLAIMLAEIDRVVKSCKAKGEHCNLILCGDFNSVPHMPLYQLITTGELYFQGIPAWMVSGQEDLSYKVLCPRLFAPLWPSCLGITCNCQYATVQEILQSQRQKPGKGQYSHDFLLQLRFCPAACVRPLNLELIPGVTDCTPDASRENHQPYDKRFRHTICHQLDLESVYKHVLQGSGSPEVTTLHSEVGATVDYIFYSPRRTLTADGKAGGDCVREGLKLTGSLSLLSEDVLWSMKGLPNYIFPSDHLSLMAKFQVDLNAS